MSLQLRAVEDSDFQEIQHWWESQGFPVIPKESLPTVSVLIWDQEWGKICAAWLYSTDSDMAWLEFLVKNPELPGEVTDLALDLAIESLAEIAKERKAKLLFTCTNKKRLKDRYERLGFKTGDQDMTHFLRRL